MWWMKYAAYAGRKYLEETIDGDGGSGSGKPAQTFSADYVRELRAENKGLRQTNTQLQSKINGFDAEKADAISKAVEEVTSKVRAEVAAEASAEADKRVLQAELKGEAVKAGLVDLDQLKLLDLSTVSLKDGQIVGADALFTSLKEAKPYLFGEVKHSSTPQNPPPQNPPQQKAAKDMTPAEYEAAKAALLK